MGATFGSAQLFRGDWENSFTCGWGIQAKVWSCTTGFASPAIYRIISVVFFMCYHRLSFRIYRLYWHFQMPIVFAGVMKHFNLNKYIINCIELPDGAKIYLFQLILFKAHRSRMYRYFLGVFVNL